MVAQIFSIHLSLPNYLNRKQSSHHDNSETKSTALIPLHKEQSDHWCPFRTKNIKNNGETTCVYSTTGKKILFLVAQIVRGRWYIFETGYGCQLRTICLSTLEKLTKLLVQNGTISQNVCPCSFASSKRPLYRPGQVSPRPTDARGPRFRLLAGPACPTQAPEAPTRDKTRTGRVACLRPPPSPPPTGSDPGPILQSPFLSVLPPRSDFDLLLAELCSERLRSLSPSFGGVFSCLFSLIDWF